MGVLCLSLFLYALLCVRSSFVIIFTKKRELVALLLLFFRGHVSVNVLWLFLTVPWDGLQCVNVVCPNHIHFCFCQNAFEMDGQQCTRFVPRSQY